MHASKSKMKSSFKVEIIEQVHAMPEMHYHDFYEIYIQNQGDRDHVVSNNYYRLSPKGVLMLKPNVLHQSITANPHTRTIIYFTADFLKKYYSDEMCAYLLSAFNENILNLTSDNYYKISQLVRELTKEDLNSRHNHIFTKLADILLLILLNNEQTIENRDSAHHSLNNEISPLVSYVHENYLALNNIDEIADTFYITKSHLCRSFKKSTGYTIIQYINNLKIQRACQLLKETDKSITDISLDCGFNSTMYFCRTFKNTLNITPSEYRKI